MSKRKIKPTQSKNWLKFRLSGVLTTIQEVIVLQPSLSTQQFFELRVAKNCISGVIKEWK
jgi:hypothetical protein